MSGGNRRVLLVHGKKGGGKTTLLREFARRARLSGRTVVKSFDLPRLGAEGMVREQLERMGVSLSRGGHGRSAEPCPAHGLGPVLLVDDADHIQTWLRKEVLPRLPDSSVVALATTSPPDGDWSIDLGWRSLTRLLHLGAMDMEESAELLDRMGVEPRERQRIWLQAAGHPLTTTLMAQLSWGGGLSGALENPDQVSSMLSELVGSPPDRLAADALFVCAHAVMTSQDLLQYVLERADVGDIWAWLCSLGVVRSRPAGLTLNHFTCRLVEADLRYRSPDRFQALHARIHEHAKAQLRASGDTLPSLSSVSCNLFAGHPSGMVRRLRLLMQCSHLEPRRGLHGDPRPLVESFRKAVGPAKAAQVGDSIARQPESLYVAERDEEVVAVAVNVVLGPSDDQERGDPVVRAVRERLESMVSLRPNETVHLLRFAADRSGDRSSTAALGIAVTALAVHWLTEDPSLGYAVVPSDQAWQQVLGELGMSPVPGVKVGDDLLFELDFRRFPPEDWLAFMGRRELRGCFGPPPPDLLRPAPLCHADFADAVLSALRNLHRLDELGRNPLNRASIVPEGPLTGAEGLRDVIHLAVSSLGTGHKDQTLARVLDVTYLRPESSQKTAAKAAGLPFSTYRRYLAQGVQRVVDLLWQAESGRGAVGIQGQPMAAVTNGG
ncbi:ATP-binding protein [Streptomyces sp. NPDC005474]|uniref:ATP-binding protein n=1 Tax=Streptomyces sp. NPDC005474 TaxID=3154878 RepID=UPI0034546CED